MIPASLIETSAEALFKSLKYVYAHPREQVGELDRQAARIVLEAAFAKLPECEEALNLLVNELTPGKGNYAVDEQSQVIAFTNAKTALAALAKMAGQSRPTCPSHKPLQHRDGKPPWCKTCGLTTNYQEPVSKLGQS